jgi:LacI family transcriptional regulator
MRRLGKRKVGVALSTELACYRDMIRGITSFAAVQASWQVELIGVNEDAARLAKISGLNGLILGGTPDLAGVRRAVKAVDGHAVAIGAQFAHHGLDGLIEIESDDLAVGRLGAEHLRAKGFRQFAFVGTDTEWSVLREKGFKDALADFDVATLMPETTIAPDSRGWRMPHFGPNVAEALKHLPKPLGVFACNDMRGRSLIDLCRNEQIRVPDEVAILAVDNDDLICDLSQPQLSSVAIPWRKMGFRCAEALEKLFIGQPVKTRRILVGPECVIERHSTDTLAVEDADVAAALRFIRTHAHEPINVEDLMQHLPVARRSLERRFRDTVGRSPLEEIRKAHTDRAKYLLAETDLSIAEVAEKSGFAHAAWLSKSFRALTGETPSQYRERFKTR